MNRNNFIGQSLPVPVPVIQLAGRDEVALLGPEHSGSMDPSEGAKSTSMPVSMTRTTASSPVPL